MQTLHRSNSAFDSLFRNQLPGDFWCYYRKKFFAYAIKFYTTLLFSFQSARSADSAPVHHAVMRVSGRMVGVSRRRGLYTEWNTPATTSGGPPPHAIAWGGIKKPPRRYLGGIQTTKRWWMLRDSNPWPSACKADALANWAKHPTKVFWL